MGFQGLLGNARIRENLQRSLLQGRISHFYLITGPQGSGKHTLAQLLAAAILCRETDRPCLRCHNCRRVLSGAHPDYITVDDPEKKTVPVKLVRQARADMFIQPNESDHKIYLFPRAQDMEPPSQNALLKVLEEPPSYGVFILLCDNPESLLPTVRSRCTELALTALSPGELRPALQKAFPQVEPEAIEATIVRSGGFLGQALQILRSNDALPVQTTEFARCFAQRDTLGLVQLLCSMEKMPRHQLVPILGQWQELLHHALVSRTGYPCAQPLATQIGSLRTSTELKTAIDTIKKCIDYTNSNVSCAAVCGYLSWELR